MIHDVIPDGTQIFHQLCFARLGIEVGNTSVEVVGTDGMSHSLVLVAELMSILVVVFAVGHAVTNGNQPFC